FVSWVKEGRKYDLGALMITQQPGSIPDELLSQGDNFFVFHLLSQGDLVALKRANAHFSDDLLSALLNEPLVGHGIFWSSAPGTDRHARPYPLSVRVLDFNKAHALRDPTYEGPALGNYAAALRRQLTEEVKKAKAAAAVPDAAVPDAAVPEQNASVDEDVTDVDATYRDAAINGLRSSTEFWAAMRAGGAWWWRLTQMLQKFAPSEQAVGDRFKWSMQVVPQALNELLGEGRWVAESREYKGAPKQWVKPTGPIPGGDQALPDDEPQL